MSKLRVESFTISIDGFGAGPEQSLENPLGVGGPSLHGWLFPTRFLQAHLLGNTDNSHLSTLIPPELLAEMPLAR